MSDYSRRNNRSSGRRSGREKPVEDDFDWDKFDRETSAISNTDGDEPLHRRRRGTESAHARSTRRPAARTSSSARSEAEHRRQDTPDRAAAVRKRRRKKKQLTEKQIKIRRRIRTTVLIAFLLFIVVCTGMCVGMYAGVSSEMKAINIQALTHNNTSEIYYYDSNGTPQLLTNIHAQNNKIWVNSDQIPDVFKNAVVAIEDERYYKHGGVDVKRTVGATIQFTASKLGIGSASYGGSTITQQVIKNITKEDEFKATRKIKEMMRAIALEQQLSKDEILTLYCNIVYFANNCTGVEAASRLYYNKSASELTLPEAASIAGITQFPAKFDPLANPEENLSKRNTVLKKMYDLGYINENEYKAAVSAPQTAGNYYKKDNEITSYFEDQVVNDVIKDLMNKYNYTEDYATTLVYNGGLKIYATVDPRIQSIMEQTFNDSSTFAAGIANAEAAMVITDPYTGEIKGLIGGLGKKEDIRGWNRATQAVRQPGSSIKPLSAYGPVIDMGKMTETDVIVDEEITIGNDNWKPKNSYSGFKGPMLMREAIARSANIPAVKIVDKVGIGNSYGYLTNKFHLSTIKESDKNYSALSLGGLTQGVTVKEIASAYGVFVNKGKYITPYTYTRVDDASGQTILANHINESQAISEGAAYVMADLLSGPVNLSYGTATSAKLQSGMPTYGKTGTTDDDFDKWFVGFTPYYVGAVWFGFDTPSSLKSAGITGNPSVKAWTVVFEQISANQPYKEIEKPSSVTEKTVCTISGKLANRSCTSVKAYYVNGTEPEGYCNSHYIPRDDKKTSGDGEKSTEAPKTSSEPSGESGSENGGGTGGTTSGGETASGGSTGGTSTGGTSTGSTGGTSTGGSSTGSTGGSSSGGTGGSTTGGGGSTGSTGSTSTGIGSSGSTGGAELGSGEVAVE